MIRRPQIQDQWPSSSGSTFTEGGKTSLLFRTNYRPGEMLHLFRGGDDKAGSLFSCVVPIPPGLKLVFIPRVSAADVRRSRIDLEGVF